jgi:hypothetical protein
VTPQEAADVKAQAYTYVAQQQARTTELVAAVVAIWAGLETSAAVESWVAGIGRKIYVLLSMVQQVAAADAARYVHDVLAAQGLTYRGPNVNPANFAGIASDGRDLESLLAGAVVHFRHAQDEGKSDAQARSDGANFLRMVLPTQIADQARAAESVTLTAANAADADGKDVQVGWIRLLTPPSCGRCAILAGRFYRWSDGFERHPMCFPAGVVASGPRMDAASRRWFEGELVTIRTASGQELSLTGNHPILTRVGWLPASLLQPGMEVFRSLGADSALGQVPDDQQVPAPVEDVFRALGVTGLATQVPSATEDFHGDGSVGQVDVVAPDRHLRLKVDAAVSSELPQSLFGRRLETTPFHAGSSGSFELFFGNDGASGRVVSGSDLPLPFGGGHAPSPYETGLRAIADLNALLDQTGADHLAGDVVFAAETVLALARRVLRRDFGVGDVGASGMRWEAPAGAFSMETRSAYAGRGADLLGRLSGQVAPDRVIEKVSRQWSGHVYNLTSSEGWLSANNLITSNCDCRHVPCAAAGAEDLTTSPFTYFKSLSEQDQDRLFGAANARAIRDGADPAQVVNATSRPGAMFTADNGRRYTREGTTRRGLFGQSDVRQRQPRVLRPTPLQIYRDAKGDQAEAIRMLKRWRYLL